MTLAELAEFITQKVNRTDTTSVDRCKGFIRRRYQMIYDAVLWRDSLVTVSKAAASGEIIIPHIIAQPVKIRWGDETTLKVTDQEALFDVDPAIFEREGSPMVFSRMTPVATAVHPSDETLQIVSDSASDGATIDILIRGEKDGTEQVEEITLNGTSVVTTTKQWDLIYTLSKETTTGTISVTGSSSAAALLTLWPEERERKFCRIKLHEIPSDTSKSLLILGKRTLRQLTEDLDTPMIRGIDNALICYAMADMLERDRQYAKAQAKQVEGGEQLRLAIDMDRNQTAQVARIIPEANTQYDWDYYDALP